MTNAKIIINIKGDLDANEMYQKFKEILYDSNLKYFDHELITDTSSYFGFRNNVDKPTIHNTTITDES